MWAAISVQQAWAPVPAPSEGGGPKRCRRARHLGRTGRAGLLPPGAGRLCGTAPSAPFATGTPSGRRRESGADARYGRASCPGAGRTCVPP